MNTIKCCDNDCQEEAIGYFTTDSSGLWLCKKHSYGKLDTTIEDIKLDDSKKWLFNMELK